MKVRPVLASLSALLLGAAPAGASNTNGWASITTLYATHEGVIIFTAQSPYRSAVPACASSQPHRFAFNASTAEGQVMATVLLSAHAARRRIWVNGDNTCSARIDTETMQYFNIED